MLRGRHAGWTPWICQCCPHWFHVTTEVTVHNISFVLQRHRRLLSTRATQTVETGSTSSSPRICVREASLEEGGSLPPTPTPQPREIPPLPPRDRDTPPGREVPPLPPRDTPPLPPRETPPLSREVPPLPPRDRDTPPPLPPIRAETSSMDTITVISDAGSLTNTQLMDFYEEQAQLYGKLTNAEEVRLIVRYK